MTPVTRGEVEAAVQRLMLEHVRYGGLTTGDADFEASMMATNDAEATMRSLLTRLFAERDELREAARVATERVATLESAAAALLNSGTWGDLVANSPEGYPRRNVEFHEDKVQALNDAVGDAVVERARLAGGDAP